MGKHFISKCESSRFGGCTKYWCCLFLNYANGAATFITKITAPNASANDYFGGSVSIHDDILAVGAIGSDPDGISNAGAAYIFRLKPDKSVEFLSVITASDPRHTIILGMFPFQIIS